MAVAPAEERILVNKRDLALKVLRCSLPTLDAWIARDASFPVVTRGGNGVEWQFDPQAVLAYIATAKEAEEKAGAERQVFFAQFALPIDEAAPPGSSDLSPAQRLKIAKARQAEQQLARETGFLVETAKVRQALQTACAGMAKALQLLPRTICAEFNLPDEIERAVGRRIADSQRRMVADLQAALGQGEPE